MLSRVVPKTEAESTPCSVPCGFPVVGILGSQPAEGMLVSLPHSFVQMTFTVNKNISNLPCLRPCTPWLQAPAPEGPHHLPGVHHSTDFRSVLLVLPSHAFLRALQGRVALSGCIHCSHHEHQTSTDWVLSPRGP